MKRNAFRNAAALAFSVTLAGAVMAQTPSPQTPQTPPPTTPQTTRPSPDSPRQDSLKNMIGQTVTVSGCLASASGSGGTTPGAPAGASSDFVLTNVQLRSGAPTAGATPGATPGSPSTGTPSTAGATGSSNTKLKLKETGAAKLSENVNKRVEVTGKLEAGSSSTAPRPETTPGAPGAPEPGAPRTSGSDDAMPELQVASVKVLEQTCTP
jgi:hypothetical protein